MALKQLLLHDPLSKHEHELADLAVRERLNQFLYATTPAKLTVALYPFVEECPWRYWDDDTLHEALSLLERDVSRTFDAINVRTAALDRGIENLFRQSQVVLYEDVLSHNVSPRELLRLATEFLPEYLRWAEHIFGNLLQVLWSVHKRGGVEGRFDLHGATDFLIQKNHTRLTEGYVDRIRNAIAHGEVQFTGTDIQFGSVNPQRLASSDFLNGFDRLCRTSNALALASMLFWVRNRRGFGETRAVPVSLMSRFAAGAVNRSGLRLVGTVESETPLAGHQLHAAVELETRSRTLVLGECAHIAAELLEAGATGYERFLFGIDHGEAVSSLVIIRSEILRQLIEADAEIDRLPEAFDETQLLWFDESRWRTRLRAWRIIFKGTAKRARLEVLKSWRAKNLWLGKGRFRIRKITNVSVAGIPRVRFLAVLRNPRDMHDRDTVNEIVWELVKRGRRRLVRSRTSRLDTGIPRLRRPQHVFIDLYRLDGPVRWLQSGGWLGGNLVAVGECVWGNREPVVVTNPEAIYRGVRLRYRIDAEAAAETLARLFQTAHEIGSGSRNST
jgi:hypothetical protein